MRWIFVILLLLNLGYPAWKLSVASGITIRPSLSQQPDNAIGADALVLLSESKATLGATSTVAAEPPENAVILDIQPQTLNANVPESPVTDSERSATTDSKQEMSNSALIDAASSSGSGDAVAIVEDSNAKSDALPVTETTEDAGANCVRIGPFSDVAPGEALLAGIGGMVREAVLQEESVLQSTVYWVHIPPRSSREQAKAVVNSLKQRKIESFIIADDENLLNGVSLGVFHDRGSADRLLNRLGKLGYPIAIRESPKYNSQYFVKAAPNTGARPELMSKVQSLAVDGAPAISVEDVMCANIAAQGTPN